MLLLGPACLARAWDERLDVARPVLRAATADRQADLAVQLAATHGGTPGTWHLILATARRHPEREPHPRTGTTGRTLPAAVLRSGRCCIAPFPRREVLMFGHVDVSHIASQLESVVTEVVAAAALCEGKLLVVGCSTSEILGERIGRAGSEDVAAALVKIFRAARERHGFAMAFQCCEHLNRALVVEAVTCGDLDLDRVHSRVALTCGAPAWRGEFGL